LSHICRGRVLDCRAFPSRNFSARPCPRRNDYLFAGAERSAEGTRQEVQKGDRLIWERPRKPLAFSRPFFFAQRRTSNATGRPRSGKEKAPALPLQAMLRWFKLTVPGPGFWRPRSQLLRASARSRPGAGCHEFEPTEPVPDGPNADFRAVAVPDRNRDPMFQLRCPTRTMVVTLPTMKTSHDLRYRLENNQ